MRLGVAGSGVTWIAPDSGSASASTPPSTPPAPETSSTGSGTTTASSGEVCSTALCVLGQ